MTDLDQGDITRILAGAAGLSREEALERLVPLVYDELRVIARSLQARGRRHPGRVSLETDRVTWPDPDTVLALDEAIRRLAEQAPRAADVVQLRYFAGLGIEETARARELSERTVKREWTFARAWLLDTLRDGTN